MRTPALLLVLSAAVGMSGCLGYGSYIDSVSLAVTSARSDLLVYLVRRDEYRQDFSALEARPAELSAALAQTKSAFVADGTTIRHAGGNFMMVWFCGQKTMTRPVQLVRANQPLRLSAACPA